MSTSRRALCAVAAVALLAAAACGRGPDSGAGAKDSGMLTIKGSDTMVHLVTAWAEAFMHSHPGVQISVTGGGSGTGVAAMINGTTDICMASREVQPKEIEQARAKGIYFNEVAVALDGIAIVVHPDNSVSELTMDQLRQVYNGTLRNWSLLGGPDQTIQALSRESNSGTYVYFNEHVLKKDDFGVEVRLMPSNAAIVQSVSQDRWSIGYVGLGYAEGAAVKVVALKEGAETPAVNPEAETIHSGSYPTARPLYLYSNGKPSGLIESFIDYALSPEGQEIVLEAGYVPTK